MRRVVRVVCLFVLAACRGGPATPAATHAIPAISARPRLAAQEPSGPTLKTIAAPAKVLVIGPGVMEGDDLVYVLQEDGRLIAWKAAEQKLPDWYAWKDEIASHVRDFDGFHAVYDDGRVAEMMGNVSLRDLPGLVHMKATAFDLYGSHCLIDDTSSVICKARDQPARRVGVARVTRVQVRRKEACALDENGDLWCWTDQLGAQTHAKGVVAFALGYRYGCAVAREGSVSCWGDDAPPLGDVRDAFEITATPRNGCVFRKEHAPLCWGGPFPSTPAEIAWLRGARGAVIGKRFVCAAFVDRTACLDPVP